MTSGRFPLEIRVTMRDFRGLFLLEQRLGPGNGTVSFKRAPMATPHPLGAEQTRSRDQMETTMAKKLSITAIATFVAASLAITPAAEAGGRGIGLGIGLGVLAVGAMAHQAHKAKEAKMARARAQAQAQARAKAQAQARAKAQAQAQARAAAKRQQEIAAAQKAKAAEAAENGDEVAAEDSTSAANKTPSTYVAAPSSTAALTQVDVSQADAAKVEPTADTKVVAAGDADAEPTKTAVVEAPETCKKYVPALGVAVNVGC